MWNSKFYFGVEVESWYEGTQTLHMHRGCLAWNWCMNILPDSRIHEKPQRERLKELSIIPNTRSTLLYWREHQGPTLNKSQRLLDEVVLYTVHIGN